MVIHFATASLSKGKSFLLLHPVAGMTRVRMFRHKWDVPEADGLAHECELCTGTD